MVDSSGRPVDRWRGWESWEAGDRRGWGRSRSWRGPRDLDRSFHWDGVYEYALEPTFQIA